MLQPDWRIRSFYWSEAAPSGKLLLFLGCLCLIRKSIEVCRAFDVIANWNCPIHSWVAELHVQSWSPGLRKDVWWQNLSVRHNSEKAIWQYQFWFQKKGQPHFGRETWTPIGLVIQIYFRPTCILIIPLAAHDYSKQKSVNNSGAAN